MSRIGSKNRAFYRIVVAEHTSPRDGKFVEKIGTYDPLLPHGDPKRVMMDLDRVKYWLSKGVKPSDRVAKFLGQANVIPMPTYNASPKKSAPKAKALERLKAAEDAKAAAIEAAKQAAEDAKAAAAAPKVEAVVEAPAEETAPAVEAVAETPAEATPAAEEPQA
jgi:small subunit ribosomal protein S16